MFSAVGKGVPAVWRLKVRIKFEKDFRYRILAIRLFALNRQGVNYPHRYNAMVSFSVSQIDCKVRAMHLAMHLHRAIFRQA